MRSQDEIAARVKIVWDPMGWQSEVLVSCLDYEHAKPWLVEDATDAQWTAEATVTDADVEVAMRDYIAYAWLKARDHRGISASRSVEKFIGWLWAKGDDDTLVEMEQVGYPMYGAPRLAIVSRRYGFPIPTDEQTMRMAVGLKCREDCMDGCGQ